MPWYTTSPVEPSKPAAVAASTSCPRLCSHLSVSTPMFSSSRILTGRRNEQALRMPTVPQYTPRKRTLLGHPPPSIADIAGGFQ